MGLHAARSMTDQANSNINLIRVVLAEDHLLTRIGLKTVLERTNDIRVIGEAENGQVAVQMVKQLKPDVVLMDVGMPLIDGIEAARLICADNPNQRIIMLTSHDNEEDIFAAMSAGAGGYCLKDVAPDRLYTAVRSIHAGDVWLDSAIAHKVLRHYQAASNAPARKRLNEVSGTHQSMQAGITKSARSALITRVGSTYPPGRRTIKPGNC
jgi:DNA-binding NarL/FixJ family response regulator